MKTLGYCVSAINRLTREREIVTPECSKENAQKVLQMVLSVHPRKRSWLYPRVELYTRHLQFELKIDM